MKTRAEQVRLLEQRIRESGLSTTRFAREVLVRDPRAVRRMLAGDEKVPSVVLDWLETPCLPPWPFSTVRLST